MNLEEKTFINLVKLRIILIEFYGLSRMFHLIAIIFNLWKLKNSSNKICLTSKMNGLSGGKICNFDEIDRVENKTIYKMRDIFLLVNTRLFQ